MSDQPMSLAELANRATTAADALVALAAEAAGKSYAAQVSVALLRAAAEANVASAYAEAAEREQLHTEREHYPERCDVCRKPLGFAGRDGERTTCSACTELVQRRGRQL